jgi:hypothetical protein
MKFWDHNFKNAAAPVGSQNFIAGQTAAAPVGRCPPPSRRLWRLMASSTTPPGRTRSGRTTYGIVDITRHKNQQLNAIPNDLQMRVKFRWDVDCFYVGAILHVSCVTAQDVGHNNHAPHSPDNDFEILIDVSGTTQYYMEYEMSAQNATYDLRHRM